MIPRWAICRLRPHLSTRSFSLSPFKTPSSQNHSPETLRSSRSHLDMVGLLSLSGREGRLHLGASLHAHIIKNSELYGVNADARHCLVVWNSLLSVYSKCGEFSKAALLFDEMPLKDTVSWNAMISGCLRTRDFESGFGFLRRMHETGFYPFDQATFTTVLSACDIPDLLCVSEMVHGMVFVSGFDQEVTVGNALVTSYFMCGSYDSGRCVFDEMLEKNVVTWTAAISGLVQNQLCREGIVLFVEMRRGPVDANALTYLSSLTACSGMQALKEGSQIHGLICKLGLELDICIGSALMDMYSKCGSMDDALQIFECAEELDAVSMTVLLVGFAQNGMEEEAIQIFVKMLKAGFEVDPNMTSAILGVFGADTSLALGKQIHSSIIKRSFTTNPFVSNGLINMYAKCGDLEDSIKVFKDMLNKNSVSWNSMIAGFARHGDGSGALQLFEDMILEGVEPTDVTYLSLLHACSHVGLVLKGIEFLESMMKVYGIRPRTEHYACVVDMLGRAGLLNEAKKFIDELPVEPGILIWQALLGACSFHGNSEVGKYAADQLSALAPETPASYILMANIYSSTGKWRERARVIKGMKEMGLAKETSVSWIEIEKKVHSFVVADKLHPEAEMTYGVLAQLFRLMIDEGYVPDKRFILYYSDEGVTAGSENIGSQMILQEN